MNPPLGNVNSSSNPSAPVQSMAVDAGASGGAASSSSSLGGDANASPAAGAPAGASASIPDAFFCPINHTLMLDPVVTCDGHTYERGAILDWFRRKTTSPLTGAELAHRNLVSNGMAKSMIRDFAEAHASLPECAEYLERLAARTPFG